MANLLQRISEDRRSTRRRDAPVLRLVRGAPAALGPISPELALVSPELAAAIRSTPDVVILAEVGSAGGGPSPSSQQSETWTDGTRERNDDPGGEAPVTMRYDTPDLLLERCGLALELESRATQRRWRLTLPRGETVEAPAGEDGVPDQIASLLATLADPGEIRRVPVRSLDPQILLLEERIHAERGSLLKHDPGTRLASDAENLHQLRVASRRLRTFLRLTRELVDGAWASEVRTPLRELGRASGPARDLDVLLALLREQVEGLDDRDREAGVELIAAAEDDRMTVQRKLLAVLDSERYRSMLERLTLPVEVTTTPASNTTEELAARELRRLLARVRKLGKTPSHAELHALRIRVKTVRYSLELSGLPAGTRTSRIIDTSVQLQNLLGEHQDAVAAEEHIRALAFRIGSTQVAYVAGRLAERQRQRRADLERRLPSAWKRLRRLARTIR